MVCFFLVLFAIFQIFFAILAACAKADTRLSLHDEQQVGDLPASDDFGPLAGSDHLAMADQPRTKIREKSQKKTRDNFKQSP